MSSNILSKLTMIIPTFMRHEFFEDIVAYHAPEIGRIILLDATPEPFTHATLFKKHQNVEYCHLPDTSPAYRLALGVEKITTPYAVIKADRRQVSTHGLRCCCTFLDYNKKYISADGHTILNYECERTAYNYAYVSKHCELEDATHRVMACMSIFEPTWYAVFRTDALRYIFSKINKLEVKDFCFHEFFHTISAYSLGKHKRVPCMYMYMPAVQYPFDRSLVGVDFLKNLEDTAFVWQFCEESSKLLKDINISEEMVYEAVMCYKNVYLQGLKVSRNWMDLPPVERKQAISTIMCFLDKNGYSSSQKDYFFEFLLVLYNNQKIQLGTLLASFTSNDSQALQELKGLVKSIMSKAPHHFKQQRA